MAAERSPDGTPSWIEIPATGDAEELKAFYRDLFPKWEFHAPYPDAYVFGYQTPQGLGGGIVRMPDGCNTNEQSMGRNFTVYFKVASLDETENRVHKLGGKTCLSKQKQGDQGYFMNFLDPHGNRFGAYEFVG